MTGDKAPNGWGIIDAGPVGESPDSSSTEKKQSETIKSLAKAVFPPPEFDDQGIHHLPPRNFMGQIVRFEYAKDRYDQDLVGIEYTLDGLGLPEEELSQFVECVSKLNSAFDDNEWHNSSRVTETIKVAKNLTQAKEFVMLVDHWKEVEKTKVSKGEMKPIEGKEIGATFRELCGEFYSPERPTPPYETSQKIIETLVDYHQVAQKISPNVSPKGVNQFKSGIERCCFENHDIGAARELTWLLQETATDDVLTLPFDNFSDTARRYAQHLSLSRETAQCFKDKLFPDMILADENVAILNKQTNSWAMHNNEFSIGEYTCHLYSAEASPQLINELILINSEIPTAVAHQFEQNRRDGVSLTKIEGLGQLKEAIHDQRPKNHEVIQAMVNFYDGKIRAEELVAISKTHSYVGRSETFMTEAIKIETYEKITEERMPDGNHEARAIDILRRLAKNTTSIPDLPPTTPYETLNKLMDQLGNVSESTVIDSDNLALALKEVNTLLADMYSQKQIGINANLITALGYLNRATAIKLRGLKFEEQVRAYRSEWFGEAIRFHDLTMNPGSYDKATTDEFIRKMQQEHTLGAYNLVGKKVAVDLNKIGRKYKDKGFGQWSEMLWSGNMSHEMLGLLDLKDPSTPEGVNYKQKFLSSEEERLKGD